MGVRIPPGVPINTRVMQSADIGSSNLSSYPFESDRAYQFWRGTQKEKRFGLNPNVSEFKSLPRYQTRR